MVQLRTIGLVLSSIIALARGSTVPLQVRAPGWQKNNSTVLILGGGVAGIIAARTLKEQGINDFIILEARDELGGRLMSHDFAGTTVELGANWVQGTQSKGGLSNPIFDLVKKHNVKVVENDFYSGVATFDQGGATNYSIDVKYGEDAFDRLTVWAGERVDNKLVDLSARTAYSLVHGKRNDAHAKAVEYYVFDWEYAQTPEQSSAIASAWINNFTFVPEEGGFSEDNLLSVDQRGFKTFIIEEAKEFLDFKRQLQLGKTVTDVTRSDSGVTVTLADGSKMTADYAICTFSLGVLQNDDVAFHPPLPDYKQEAIQTMTMATYTKIFLKFDHKFWFDNEIALYADSERGRYAVWQNLDTPRLVPDSHLLITTVTGDFSERIELLTDDQVKAEVMSVLRTMYPDIEVPEPTAFYFPRWFNDKLFRGSYSNWPPSFFSEHHDNLRANIGRLWFAGEYTSLKYYGFLHGAYYEGLDIAKKVGACIKKGKCPNMPYEAQVVNGSPYNGLKG